MPIMVRDRMGARPKFNGSVLSVLFALDPVAVRAHPMRGKTPGAESVYALEESHILKGFFVGLGILRLLTA